MTQRLGMVGVAADLMHDIREIDASRNVKTLERRDSVTATVMREVGFSDQDIVAKLGYLPRPLDTPVRRRGRTASNRTSHG